MRVSSREPHGGPGTDGGTIAHAFVPVLLAGTIDLGAPEGDAGPGHDFHVLGDEEVETIFANGPFVREVIEFVVSRQ